MAIIYTNSGPYYEITQSADHIRSEIEEIEENNRRARNNQRTDYGDGKGMQPTMLIPSWIEVTVLRAVANEDEAQEGNDNPEDNFGEAPRVRRPMHIRLGNILAIGD